MSQLQTVLNVNICYERKYISMIKGLKDKCHILLGIYQFYHLMLIKGISKIMKCTLSFYLWQYVGYVNCESVQNEVGINVM